MTGSARDLRMLWLWFCAVQIWSGLILYMWPADGRLRSGLLAAGLLLLWPLRQAPPRWFAWPAGGRTPRLVLVLLALGVLLDLGYSSYTTLRVFKSLHIPIDQGQATWRAVRVLWQGENPYGPGAMIDFSAYGTRTPQRAGTPLETRLPPDRIRAVEDRYDKTLDPALRQELLPLPDPLPADLAYEARLSGYKYGPVILMATALLEPLHHPAVVVLLNIALTAALFVVLGFAIRREAGGDRTLTLLGIASVLLERAVTHAYASHTTTDVWALVPMGLAILAHQRGRTVLPAVLLAVATGAKIFPSLILAPLLLCRRPVLGIAAFAIALAAIELPWFALDPKGFTANAVFWALIMAPDGTSWVSYAPPAVAAVARIGLFAAIGYLWWRYVVGRETRIYWTLATTSTLLVLAGGGFHNNYLPWATVWTQVAIVEACTAARRRRAADPAARSLAA